VSDSDLDLPDSFDNLSNSEKARLLEERKQNINYNFKQDEGFKYVLKDLEEGEMKKKGIKKNANDPNLNALVMNANRLPLDMSKECTDFYKKKGITDLKKEINKLNEELAILEKAEPKNINILIPRKKVKPVQA